MKELARVVDAETVSEKRQEAEGMFPAHSGRGAAEEIDTVGLSMVVAVEGRGSVSQFFRYRTQLRVGG